MSKVHPSWLNLCKYPDRTVLCPRCGARRDVMMGRMHWHWNEAKGEWDKADLNWRWDEEAGSWLCTRPSCMETRKVSRISIWQRKYAPVPQ